jgi:hypothetical protein
MKLFKLVIIDLGKCLPIKMNQFIGVVVRKDLRDHVWAKPFLKELFESPPIMAAVIQYDQIAFLEFRWLHPLV